MNPAFFQQVETALASERLDAYRQDGATPVRTDAKKIGKQTGHLPKPGGTV